MTQSPSPGTPGEEVTSVLDARDFFGCPSEFLTDRRMRTAIVECIKKSGFRIMRRSIWGIPLPWLHVGFCSFWSPFDWRRLLSLHWPWERQGFTMTVVLAESSFVIHAWPQGGAAHPTLEYCNLSMDNSDKAQIFWDCLYAKFNPRSIDCRKQYRRPTAMHLPRAA